ncbi:ABC transporter substrate-binding protein [Nocardioides alcanivorans]|uniref:ABC transporter substrate-binding protein n=1 Tax=Nocardioides alcanivorans TaxID=2897352 RepID=UPI001F3B7715|nr:ABC transporter substrate-binding protein [Nocardioides alcanivorans]
MFSGVPFSRTLRTTLVLPVALMTFAACSSSTGISDGPDDRADRTYREGMVGAEDGGDPKDGGVLTVGSFAEPGNLDPAAVFVSGSAGGTEILAVFDSLLRYDSSSTEFVPQLAKSLEPNDDSTVWTLELRQGVSFTDGTPLDADAVLASQERYVKNKGIDAALWNENVVKATKVDDITVEYELKRSWPNFPSLLSTGLGMIVAASSDAGAEFEPVGAGPFKLADRSVGEDLTLARNDSYWAGPPHLDAVRFAYLSSPDVTQDSLKAGEIDVAFARDPRIVEENLDSGLAGYLNMVAASDGAIINANEGRPGEDVRVRKAVQLAIDPELIRQRVNGGSGIADSRMFPPYSQWHTDVAGPAYDPEEAKRLLQDAKADGYDGKITYLDGVDPAARDTSLALKALLENVGFEVERETVRSASELITRVHHLDYDLAGWGLSYRESEPYSKMFSTLHTAGAMSYGMATSDEMDALLAEFQTAADAAKKTEVAGRIQEYWNENVPYVNWAPIAELTAWNSNVHGIEGSARSMVSLADAWMQ